eukprot:1782939-Heterocapsa_arctica.AAC.1
MTIKATPTKEKQGSSNYVVRCYHRAVDIAVINPKLGSSASSGEGFSPNRGISESTPALCAAGCSTYVDTEVLGNTPTHQRTRNPSQCPTSTAVKT